MNIQNLLNQFTGGGDSQSSSTSGGLNQIASSIPGGFAGGAAAGGIMALLVGNKKARKFAGKAATVGGAAVLGGLAFNAYKNWQGSQTQTAAAPNATSAPAAPLDQQQLQNPTNDFQLTLVKAMIAAAKADGHIDSDEQKRIFDAVDQMQMDNAVKGVLFDLLRQDISLAELASGATSLEQKTELYLASCLAIDPDQPSEQAHLSQLAAALQLPDGLAEHIQLQAKEALEQ